MQNKIQIKAFAKLSILNRLAKQKQNLEKHLATLDPNVGDPQTYRDQARFVENQIRWCMQGWAKATPAVRKRLLRRTVKEIVVTKYEMEITFWTSTDERDGSLQGEALGDSEGVENVVAFRRRSPQATYRNLSVIGSGNIGIGRPCPKVVEQHGLVILREYKVLWKKPTLDMTLLAQLRNRGLGSRQICKIMEAPRTTVAYAILRLEKDPS